jgi:hypothetical protein
MVAAVELLLLLRLDPSLGEIVISLVVLLLLLLLLLFF